MTESDPDKLLGGFAADTLTPEERQRLFTAALRDQQLFNALADEQALKEMLADPAVRRRLLQALEQADVTRAGSALSWIDWFRRPAGLALAGGLVTAALAVVLGTKFYQDNLHEATLSVQSEEPEPMLRSTSPSPPSQPSFPKPEQELQERVETEPRAENAKKEATTDKRVGSQNPVRPPASEREKATARQTLPKRTKPTGSESGKADEQPGSPVAKDEKARLFAPATTTPKPTQNEPMPQSSSEAPVQFLAEEDLGVRALFYAEAPVHGDRRAMAKEQRLQSATEAQPPADKPAQELRQLSDAGPAAQPATKPVRPLGLRYSFVITGSDGQDQEVDAAKAVQSGRARLTLETNQNGYLQALATIGAEEPWILFPDEQTAKSFAPVAAGNRIEVPLPSSAGRKPITLTVRLSRKPLESDRPQQHTASGRTASGLLVESISSGGPAGTQEQAVYIVSQDRSPAADLTLDIPLSPP